MKNTLRLNHDTRTIVMDRTFARYAADTMSLEYAHLQQVRQDYPTYTVMQRHIRKCENKECYRGLTYRYMEDYISSHGTEADMLAYKEKRLIPSATAKLSVIPRLRNGFCKRTLKLHCLAWMASSMKSRTPRR